MTYAIQILRNGGPEVLQTVDFDPGDPGPGEIRIVQHAIGLNYIDTYMRSGLYPVELPAILGVEGAGVVVAVGEGVDHLVAGDRVAYCQGAGAYASERLHNASQVVKLPDSVGFDDAAALMLQGLTVWYLLKRSYAADAGDQVLWHAAAGGVGLLACQWAAHLGVNLIGTASSEQKCELAMSYGASHMINYRTADFVQETLTITGGDKLPVVYDSVGKDTWEGSLNLIKPFGYMISFGNSSGAVPPVDIGILNKKGAIYLQRPSLFPYIDNPKSLKAAADELFSLVGQKILKPYIGQRIKLSQVRKAHELLEARATIGATILTLDL